MLSRGPGLKPIRGRLSIGDFLNPAGLILQARICHFYYLTNSLNFRRFISSLSHCHSAPMAIWWASFPFFFVCLLFLPRRVSIADGCHARLRSFPLSRLRSHFIFEEIFPRRHVWSSISIIKSIDSWYRSLEMKRADPQAANTIAHFGRALRRYRCIMKWKIHASS